MRRLLALALAAGCGGHSGRGLEGRYDLGAPGDGWHVVQPGGADKAWYNADLSASIYADSNCGARYDDAPLGRLIDSLSLGVAGQKVREEARNLDGREALLRVFDGSLDGVAVRVGALALKKDKCVYDVIYIAPPANFDAGEAAFEAVVSAFSARGGS
jgi:hypothetical protein